MPRPRGWGKRAKPKPSQRILTSVPKGPKQVERYLDQLSVRWAEESARDVPVSTSGRQMWDDER